MPSYLPITLTELPEKLEKQCRLDKIKAEAPGFMDILCTLEIEKDYIESGYYYKGEVFTRFIKKNATKILMRVRIPTNIFPIPTPDINPTKWCFVYFVAGGNEFSGEIALYNSSIEYGDIYKDLIFYFIIKNGVTPVTKERTLK